MKQTLSFLLGGLFGGLLGGFGKFVWEKWIPDRMAWHRQQEMDRTHLLSSLRAPTIQAVSDLQSRIFVIVTRDNENYYFLKKLRHGKYYVDSTSFLIARCYAWLELLRERMSAFDYPELFDRLETVHRAFSGGHGGFQVFALEQREIAERMQKATGGDQVRSMGYSDFIDILRTDSAPTCFVRLHKSVANMLDAWPRDILRLTLIQHALMDMILFLDPDARWVARGRRTKIDVSIVVGSLVSRERLREPEAKTLIDEARSLGLVRSPVDP